MDLQPIQADYDELWRQNPLAREQLKVIVLGRMVAQRDVKIAELEKEKPEE